MAFETLTWGYGLVEGPTVAGDDSLCFSDVLGGGVYRLPAGEREAEILVPKRRGVGGLALHADGGVVASGRDLVHVRSGVTRSLLADDQVAGWNDLCTDRAGRLYAGALRFAVFDPNAEPVPGECRRVDAAGEALVLYGGVIHANGIALSPGEDRIYHSDTRAGVVLVHDLTGSGRAVPREPFAFPPGMPDGIAVDEAGCVWVASAGGGCVARLTPGGDVDRALEVPARLVTSVCLGGGDGRDLHVTTADNAEDEARRGTVFRTRVDVAGAPVHPARV